MNINDHEILELSRILEDKLEEEFAILEKTLIVVDVQEEFSQCFNDDYLTELKYYIEGNDFERIIVVVDISEGCAAIPYWLKIRADMIIEKSYFAPGIKYIKTHPEEFAVIEKNKSWRNKDGQLVIATKNEHETFIVPKTLEEVAPEIKCAVLVGGAYLYCIEDVKMVLKYFNVKHKFEYRLVYNDELADGVYLCDWTDI